MQSFQASEVSSLDGIALTLLNANPKTRVFLFDGEMGAGKTTFINALCDVLGVVENTGSPTYSIVNEYAGREGQVIYHFDFYRIKNLEEAIDMGFEEYLDSGAYCLIEWPEKVTPLLPPDSLYVSIDRNGKERIISFPTSV
jgi:tRNA threonylcarbamoyladenosine biosynthesis protein TsaE